MLIFAPDHLVDYADVGLDDFHHFCADVLVDIVRDRDAVVVVAVHLNGCFNSLEESLSIYTADEEAALVHGLGALCGGTDADGRERVAYACEIG